MNGDVTDQWPGRGQGQVQLLVAAVHDLSLMNGHVLAFVRRHNENGAAVAEMPDLLAFPLAAGGGT